MIVDDDSVSIKKLSDDLSAFSGISVTNTTTSVEEAKKMIVAVQPDLLFLDVEMPGMSGIDLLQEIRSEIHPDMRIIFYTAHDKYFRNALMVSDFDYYLMKPYTPEELTIAMKRIQEKESKATVEQLLQKIIRDNRFAIQAVSGVKFLRYDDILLFECPKRTRNWQIMFADEREPLPLRSAVSYKDILSITPNFVQINQNYIINLTHLSFIENHTLKCKFLHHPRLELKISSRYYRKIRELLDIL
jgi:two-component system LytT family response regulator